MIVKNAKLYYGAYVISYLTYGILLVSLGPLIPFLASGNHILETQYSFLFTCRATGMFVGSLLMNWIQSMQTKPTLHQLLAISSLWISITSLFFIISSSQFYQGMWILIGAIGYFILQISINICIIVLSQKDKLEFWLMFINGVFGIGGFISPILVRICEIQSYYAISVMVVLIIPIYILLPSPQVVKKEEQKKCNCQRLISVKAQLILSFIIFIYLGSIASKGSWSSSYAVMSKISNKEEATLFPSLFFLAITLSRFAILLIKIRSSQKLKYSILGVIIFEIISIFLLKMGFQKPALIFNSILIALFMSTIYALVFSISSEFDMPLTEKQASSIATWGVLGEGILSPFFAKMMEIFTLDMFFYLNIIFYIFMWFAKNMVMNELAKSLQKMPIQTSLIKQKDCHKPSNQAT